MMIQQYGPFLKLKEYCTDKQGINKWSNVGWQVFVSCRDFKVRCFKSCILLWSNN